jgi:hypothetical protein
MPVEGYTSLTIPKDTLDKMRKFADSKGMASSTEFIKWLLDRYDNPLIRGVVDTTAVSKVEFTEWPEIYEEIILHPKVKYYFSTAWIRSKDYVKKAGGPQWVVDRRLRMKDDFCVEKTFILSPNSWCANEVWQWIGAWLAYANPFIFGDKIQLFVVKEKDARNRKVDERYYDMGVYGDQGLGFLTVDETSKTGPYTLVKVPTRGGAEEISRATAIFRELKGFAHPLRGIEDLEGLRKEVYEK